MAEKEIREVGETAFRLSCLLGAAKLRERDWLMRFLEDPAREFGAASYVALLTDELLRQHDYALWGQLRDELQRANTDVPISDEGIKELISDIREARE